MADAQLMRAVLEQDHGALLDEWVGEQLAATTMRRDLISDADLRRESAEFLRLLPEAVAEGVNGAGPNARELRDLLARLSRDRAVRGFSPSETAMFVLSLKPPLFRRLRDLASDGGAFAEAVWTASSQLDALALHTTEVFQKSREEVINRQQQELMELSTPVVKVWDRVLAVPLIGTLDSARTQVVMESLLQRIVETEAEVAIIDITGVPTVDTLVAQHLIKTVAAARLMGAECIISGIRPQIAQTIVHLGVTLDDTMTKATLADAIATALRRVGYTVSRVKAAG